jgi:hypothetical protein
MKTRALGVSIASVLLLAAVLAFRWAERDGCFDLDTVFVTGLGCCDTTAVAEVIQDAFGVALHSIDTDSLAHELCSVPGVSAASVTLIWPSSAHLEITLENAAAVLETPAGPVPVNRFCRRLPDAFLSGDLPVIRYSADPDTALLVSAVEFTEWLGEQREGTVVILDSTGVNVMDNDLMILLGSERLEERWVSWGLVSPMASGACQVDLRFRGQAVFRRNS